MAFRISIVLLASFVVPGCEPPNKPPPTINHTITGDYPGYGKTLGDKEGAETLVTGIKVGDQLQTHHQQLASNALEFGYAVLGGSGTMHVSYLFRDASMISFTVSRTGVIKDMSCSEAGLPDFLVTDKLPQYLFDQH
jgi:hypothetical protein